jgi:mannosyltransferase
MAVQAPPSEIQARTRGLVDRTFFIVLVGILVLAAWLRLVQLHESLWLDELHTAWTVADGWREIAWRAEYGNQSPLYFYLVALATGIGGLDEWVLRLPSAVAGVALVGLAGWLAASWTGSRASGWLAAALVAVDRTSLFYAQEARPYAWVQLVALLHLAVFVSMLTRPRLGWRAVWVITGLGVYYLHFTAALLLVAEAVAYLILWAIPAWRPAYRFRQFAADLALIALGVLPSVSQVSQIAARRDAWSVFIRREVPVWKILSLYPLWIYLLLPAGIGLTGWATRFAVRWRSFRQVCRSAGECFRAIDPRLLVVLVCWLFVPLILAWILTVGDVARLFFPRYLVGTMVATALMAGVLLRCCSGWLSRLIVFGTLVSALVWHGNLVPQMLADGRVIGDRRQDWRGAVALLQRRDAGEDSPVFVRSGLIEADRLRAESSPRLHQYCLLPVRGIYRLDVPPENLHPLPCRWSGELSEPELVRIAEAGQVWFLLAGSPRSIAVRHRQLTQSLVIDGRAMRLDEQHTFGEVAVLHYTREPRP